MRISNLFIFVFFCILFFSNPVLGQATLSYNFNLSTPSEQVYSAPEIVRSTSLVFHLTTDVPSSCKFSKTPGLAFEAMETIFEYNFETYHRQSFLSLSDGIYLYSLRCRDILGRTSQELLLRFAVSTPIYAKVLSSVTTPFHGGMIKLTLVTSKPALSTPMLSYSFDNAHFIALPLEGSGNTWDGYLSIPEDAGEAVGSFAFIGKDIEGFTGEEITEGKLFLVDTIPPKAIISFSSIGRDGLIALQWRDDQDVREYRIYRALSAPVKYEDFYKSVTVTSFSDTTVERGKTYYYRIAAVDDAGNEGELSPEVSATVLLHNSTVIASGLPLELYGLVDASLQEILVLRQSANSLQTSFAAKDSLSKSLYDDLQLKQDIESVLSELQALEREVVAYKSQPLSRIELQKKIDAANIKLHSFKKRLPESITVNSQLSGNRDITEVKIQEVFVTLFPESSEQARNRALRLTQEALRKTPTSISFEAYQISLLYLDGSSKELSLVKENVRSSIGRQENFSLFELIPKTLAERASELDVKTISYSVAKDDPILAFPSDTTEILYLFPKKIDISSVKDITTVMLYSKAEEEPVGGITGYSILSAIPKFSSFWSVFLICFIVIVTGGYVVMMKRTQHKEERIQEILGKAHEALSFVERGEYQRAHLIYEELSLFYSSSGSKVRAATYPAIHSLYLSFSRYRDSL